LRRVGIELEVGHLSLDETLELVQGALGGRIERESAAQGCVEHPTLGRIGVEVDALALKERSYLRPLESIGVDADSKVAHLIEDSVVRVAREIVPIEVVTSAVTYDRLHEFDPMWKALRKGGAHDTRASLLYAFGMHLNPEAPDLEAGTIARYIRAFLLLEPWLSERVDVDMSRLIAPFIRAFPDAYLQRVLEPDYAPDWDALIADYIEHNPTRNRPLDMVPLFVSATSIDLSSQVEEWALVKPRPTFHYRLPNSEVQSPGWTPAIDWNRWIEVEKLAASPELLRELCVRWQALRASDDAPASRPWIEWVRTRLAIASEPAPTLEPV
jgi:hypothetical protein